VSGIPERISSESAVTRSVVLSVSVVTLFVVLSDSVVTRSVLLSGGASPVTPSVTVTEPLKGSSRRSVRVPDVGDFLTGCLGGSMVVSVSVCLRGSIGVSVLTDSLSVRGSVRGSLTDFVMVCLRGCSKKSSGASVAEDPLSGRGSVRGS